MLIFKKLLPYIIFFNKNGSIWKHEVYNTNKLTEAFPQEFHHALVSYYLSSSSYYNKSPISNKQDQGDGRFLSEVVRLFGL